LGTKSNPCEIRKFDNNFGGEGLEIENQLYKLKNYNIFYNNIYKCFKVLQATTNSIKKRNKKNANQPSPAHIFQIIIIIIIIL
jgi:hypothetical protein